MRERASERERAYACIQGATLVVENGRSCVYVAQNGIPIYTVIYRYIYTHTHTGGHIGVGQWQNGIQIQGPGYPGNVCVCTT